jgi:hypothetical protein
MKRILCGLCIILFVPCLIFAQKQSVTMKKVGRFAQVYRGKTLLFRVALKGREPLPEEDDYSKIKKYDEAFMAGMCLVVRRDVQPTELFPEVSRLEIYQTNGRKRIYRESDLQIRRLDSIRIFASPDSKWAVIPDEEEGDLAGFFHISEDCKVQQVSFPTDGAFSWGDDLGGNFIDALTLKLSSIAKKLPNKQEKKVDIFIKKDGKFSIKDL